MAETDERAEELETISAIYPELAIDEHDQFSATLKVGVTPSKPLYIRFKPASTDDG